MTSSTKSRPSPTASALRSIIAELRTKFDLDPEAHEIRFRDTALCHTGAHVTVYTSYTIDRTDATGPTLCLFAGVARCEAWQDGAPDLVTIYSRR